MPRPSVGTVVRGVGLVFVGAATVLAFAGRLVLVGATRRRWPALAAAVERWWVWAPFAAVCLFLIWVVPPVGILATVVALVLLTRGDATGSPFRPRR
jgi:hypothetical protein